MNDRCYTPGPDETLTDILSDDDAVEEMPAERVKEAYVRMKLFEVAKERYLEPKYGRESMANDDYDRLMDFLEEWDVQGVQMALQVYAGKAYSHDFVRDVNEGEVTREAARRVVDRVFDEITKTSIAEERRIEAVRDSLKSTLRSCGMPRPKIARAVVQNWKSERARE
ncbi:hypothetical protein [Halorhabdus rudnickae]|uniref:hypothetical protein n=1 Tax=Halorhabdus rudnickae TaxID=1775544 RepID=UPI001083790C|nr:hypothetical protein [Halorhabdus rudnickae]